MGDELATKALTNCRDAMACEGKILVLEPLVLEGNQPGQGKSLDLTMLTMQHGGRVRTASEHKALFAAAGLELTRIIPTSTPLNLIEGVRELEPYAEQ